MKNTTDYVKSILKSSIVIVFEYYCRICVGMVKFAYVYNDLSLLHFRISLKPVIAL